MNPESVRDLDVKRLPRHVAFIMDGNGRWAQQRNLPRVQGHIEGVKRVEDIVDVSRDLGIPIITMFTFSTENWTRPETEVTMLMKIVATVLERKLPKMQNDNMRFCMIGRRDNIPGPILQVIDKVVEETRHNTGLRMNMAFNYGGRLEMLDAIKKIAGKVKQGDLDIEDITENVVNDALYTAGLPDPDLLIRTSGEQRISNFLLWQLSYTELYFANPLWPDFSGEEYKKALVVYQNRERRFGHL